MTSAWAVGSERRIGWLKPRPTTCPSNTTRAPTGTSPAAPASRACSRASAMYSSSVMANTLHLPHRSAALQWPAAGPKAGNPHRTRLLARSFRGLPSCLPPQHGVPRGAGVFEILHHDSRHCFLIDNPVVGVHRRSGAASRATSPRSGPKGRAPQAPRTPSSMRAQTRRNPDGNAWQAPAAASCRSRMRWAAPGMPQVYDGAIEAFQGFAIGLAEAFGRDVPRVACLEYGRESGHGPGVDDQRFLLEPQAAFHSVSTTIIKAAPTPIASPVDSRVGLVISQSAPALRRISTCRWMCSR